MQARMWVGPRGVSSANPPSGFTNAGGSVGPPPGNFGQKDVK